MQPELLDVPREVLVLRQTAAWTSAEKHPKLVVRHDVLAVTKADDVDPHDARLSREAGVGEEGAEVGHLKPSGNSTSHATTRPCRG